MLHLVHPAGSDGRVIGEHSLAAAEETNWRISSPTGRGGAPRYGFHRILIRSPEAADVAINWPCQIDACQISSHNGLHDTACRTISRLRVSARSHEL